MDVLVTCKEKEDPFKNEGTRVGTTFIPLLVFMFFLDAQGQLTPLSEAWSGHKSNSFELLW